MGAFRIEVNAVGGHGCDRDKKDGEIVYGCGRQDCPDCLTAKFVADLARSGAMIDEAKLTHWPGEPTEVVDTFDKSNHHIRARRTRKGSF